MTSLVIIMNYVLKRSNNLINAIWIHFCFNLIYSFLIVEIDFYMIMTIIFALVGTLFILLEFNSERNLIKFKRNNIKSYHKI
jgi:chromate transport protein ChrA